MYLLKIGLLVCHMSLQYCCSWNCVQIFSGTLLSFLCSSLSSPVSWSNLCGLWVYNNSWVTLDCMLKVMTLYKRQTYLIKKKLVGIKIYYRCMELVDDDIHILNMVEN